MQQISTNELPENLQKLFTEVQRTKTPLTVIHEGKPLVIISPATTQPKRTAFGAMKGSGEILGDLITPAVPPKIAIQFFQKNSDL
ncbi:MAG: type II toxin-antitoxin system Phd/YefM family antitoxin [Richelia sp. RM2_1_2]|nr:type II toxin-antitoxin system Phd/YefM family antitoxin [Richelia sp. RM2_1_2]